ncbi:outer mitochondrial transmembrane helix translocase [Drosophila tropicalis]|uniref:outer mitochondrial transmembrane helix translocase n=1 Tax=Drosophila tropicalis TaxID=46794 RepID=UPI0035ABCB8E
MDSSEITRGQVMTFVVRVCIVTAITYYSAKWMIGSMDPNRNARKKAKQQAEQQLRKLNALKAAAAGTNSKFRARDFNEHEVMIASHLVTPDEIDVNWSDVAGLDAIIQELRESVVMPVRHRELFKRSKLFRAPKGVLLHGPPGCGKTLIAKAIAKEADMRFINLDVGVLTDKWYGESQKLATAVFTCAKKLQPCIIFIDEIESFLRARGVADHEATAMMKTQFMLQWDGLISDGNSLIIVLGATNRPQDLDKAILRRMPAQFHIGPPGECQRRAILQLILQKERLDSAVNLPYLARVTVGFSGSDLKELCRHASMYRMREFMRDRVLNDNQPDNEENLDDASDQLVISMDDLLKSFNSMKASKIRACNVFEKDLELD